ncbi:MAG: polyhydroxyalkanoic acid system family protein [Betaproteobacteria bacterium]
MSDIHYVRRHNLPLAKAKKIAQKTADDMAEEYDLVSEWDGDTLHFRRSGVEGTMHVATQQIALDVKLGFLLRAFKGAFERHIERHLDELLLEAAPAKPAVRKAAKKA